LGGIDRKIFFWESFSQEDDGDIRGRDDTHSESAQTSNEEDAIVTGKDPGPEDGNYDTGDDSVSEDEDTKRVSQDYYDNDPNYYGDSSSLSSGFRTLGSMGLSMANDGLELFRDENSRPGEYRVLSAPKPSYEITRIMDNQ